MLKEIVLSFKDIRSQLVRFGFCGDKGILIIRFDCTKFFEGKDTKVAKLLLIKPDGTNSAINLTVENGMAVYAVEEGVTDVSGYGTYQLLLEDGTNLMHSPKGMYYVGEVINDPNPTPPVPTGLTGRTFMLNGHLNISDQFSVINVVSFDVEYPEVLPLFNVVNQSGDEVVCACLRGFYEPPVDPKLNGRTAVVYFPIGNNSPITAYLNGWQSQELRTITFVSEPKDGDFQGLHYANTEETLAWLAENATEVTGHDGEYIDK